MVQNSPEIQINAIQHLAYYVADGMRTTVFFSGCPLRCPWCWNPESSLQHATLACNATACLGSSLCRHCARICGRAAIYFNEGKVSVARDLCDNCGKCAGVCPTGALFASSHKCSIEAVMAEACKDSDFVANGGGIAIGGGEPLYQPHGLAALLRQVKDRGLNALVETCGFFDFDAKPCHEALKLTDVVLFDIKHADPVIHRRFTGIDNTRILHNLSLLLKTYPKTTIRTRTLIVPQFNDTPEAMRDIARQVKRAGLSTHILDRYSPLCRSKYVQLGMPFEWTQATPSNDQYEEFTHVFLEEGINVIDPASGSLGIG